MFRIKLITDKLLLQSSFFFFYFNSFIPTLTLTLFARCFCRPIICEAEVQTYNQLENRQQIREMCLCVRACVCVKYPLIPTDEFCFFFLSFSGFHSVGFVACIDLSVYIPTYRSSRMWILFFFSSFFLFFVSNRIVHLPYNILHTLCCCSLHALKHPIALLSVFVCIAFILPFIGQIRLFCFFLSEILSFCSFCLVERTHLMFMSFVHVPVHVHSRVVKSFNLQSLYTKRYPLHRVQTT